MSIEDCPTCSGTGANPKGSAWSWSCPTCGGTGKRPIPHAPALDIRRLRSAVEQADAAYERLFRWAQVARFENGDSEHDFRNALGAARGHLDVLRALLAVPEKAG